MRVLWPSERAYVEAELRKVQPVIADLRHDWILYLAVAVIALAFDCAVVIVHAAAVWAVVAGASVGVFGSKAYMTCRLWMGAKAYFAGLCEQRMWLMRGEQIHEAEVAYMRRTRRGDGIRQDGAGGGGGE